MGYRFTLKLNRVMTDEEFATLREAGCTGSTMTTISLDDFVVTQLDVDTEAANLAEAIQSGLNAVETVPDLAVNSLDVPPQPSGLPDENEPETEGTNGHGPAALPGG